MEERNPSTCWVMSSPEGCSKYEKTSLLEVFCSFVLDHRCVLPCREGFGELAGQLEGSVERVDNKEDS